MISLIAAQDLNGVIGRQGEIPWSMRDDLRFFKAMTLGRRVIVGRKTYDGLPVQLLGREVVVLSTSLPLDHYTARHVKVARSLPEALTMPHWEATDLKEIMVIGGDNVYRQALPCADKVYLTIVDTVVKDGDAFFPPLSPKVWNPTQSVFIEKSDPNGPMFDKPHNQFTGKILTFERVKLSLWARLIDTLLKLCGIKARCR